MFLLVGFALVHLAEKFAYKHARSVKLVRELKVIHLVIFFGYYFLVGLTIEDKAHIGILEAVLFVVPVTIHTALSTSSLAQMHGRVRESLVLKITMSIAPVLGTAVAMLVPIPPVLDSVFTSLVAGVLLYVFVKEFLPEERKGEPWFFILGLVVYSVFTFILTFVLR